MLEMAITQAQEAIQRILSSGSYPPKSKSNADELDEDISAGDAADAAMPVGETKLADEAMAVLESEDDSQVAFPDNDEESNCIIVDSDDSEACIFGRSQEPRGQPSQDALEEVGPSQTVLTKQELPGNQSAGTTNEHGVQLVPPTEHSAGRRGYTLQDPWKLLRDPSAAQAIGSQMGGSADEAAGGNPADQATGGNPGGTQWIVQFRNDEAAAARERLTGVPQPRAPPANKPRLGEGREQVPGEPLNIQEPSAELGAAMACECTGCSVPGCEGSTLKACGWPLGKRKREAMRCHWCPAADDLGHRIPPCRARATPPANPDLVPLRETPLDKPLFLWHDGTTHTMPSTVAGYSIPKVRHTSGPCWQAELGGIKEHIETLHRKSARFGWSLCYWSHEAMNEEIRSCGTEEVREAYFAINDEYKVARSDIFRPWVLHKHGGMWLDLRGAPAHDEGGIGLEGVNQHFKGKPPPLVLCYGGQHREKFGGQHGEIISGFMMSAPGLPVWITVWKHTAEMVRTYPERWRKCRQPGGHEEVVDDSRTYFTAPVGMTGREGVLCLGPLAMSQVMYEYLMQREVLDECMPKSLRNFWSWNSLTPCQKSWANVQGRLFYRNATDAAKHRHYSKLKTPIVAL